MLKTKTIIVPGIIFLFMAGAIIPASAQNLCQMPLSIEEQEALAFENCILCVEQAAQDATSYGEFMRTLQDLVQKNDFSKFPIIREFMKKLFVWMVRQNGIVVAGHELSNIFNRDTSRLRNSANYFVISHGTYNRLRPQKENEVKLFKQGLVLWRYSDKTPLIHGKTVIIEKSPFELKKRVIGEQIGFIVGFKGVYLDIESRLTGMSYMFFMGRAQRVRALDITPFSK